MNQKKSHVSHILKKLEFKKGKIFILLEKLLKQLYNSSIHDINDDFDYNDFDDDDFNDFDDKKINHDHESE